jgi:hypothetical protein
MNTSPESGRRLVYALLITVAAGLAAGRLLSAERVYEPSLHRPPTGTSEPPRPAWPAKRPKPWPTFSSNDRSRWATVRALVDEGTWVIGRRDPQVVLCSAPAALAARDVLQASVLLQAGYAARVASDEGIIFEDGFQSVDKVLHPSQLEFYSTKPPLLTVLAAGEYWLLKHAFGWSIVEQRWAVIRTIVFTFNVVPLVLYLLLLSRFAERFGSTDWGRYYVVAAGCFATLVTPFLISFNNHTVATTSALAALYLVVRLAEKGGGNPGAFALAGLAAGFTACMELPALALAAGLFAYLLWRWPARALGIFLPAALVPAVALVGLNYVQLGQLRPAYAEFGGPWYQYEGSHWRVVPGVVKRGIDWAGGVETKPVYAFHLLLGHHGVFSLTPWTLLAFAGMGWGAWRSLASGGRKPPVPAQQGAHAPRSPWNLLAAFALLVSLVVIGFYIVKSDNYGGWSNGPRWLMWLTPLWLVALLPVADRLGQSRRGRALALVLLGVSVLSVSHMLWNPWRHPWLYWWMEARGWIRY